MRIGAFSVLSRAAGNCRRSSTVDSFLREGGFGRWCKKAAETAVVGSIGNNSTSMVGRCRRRSGHNAGGKDSALKDAISFDAIRSNIN